MPVLSCVETVILFCIFWKKSTLKERIINLIVLLLILEIICPTGAFIQMGTVNFLSVQTVAQYIIGGYCIIEFIAGNVKLSNRLLFGLGAYLLVIFFLLVIDYVYPYQGLVPYATVSSPWDDYALGKSGLEQYKADFFAFFTVFLKLSNCAIVVTAAKALLNKSDLYIILARTVFWGRYYCWIGAFDFVMQNILDSSAVFYSMRDIICGLNSNPDFNHGIKKGDLYAIVGMAYENSNFVMSMFYLIISMMVKIKIEIKNELKHRYNCKAYIVFSIVLMILSGGFSSIWYLVMVALCWLLLRADIVNYSARDKYKVFIKFVISAGLMLLVAYFAYVVSDFENSYYGKRLLSVFVVLDYFSSGNFILSTTQDNVGGSELARLTSLLYGGQIILERPLIGIGLGVMKVHDVTLSFLMGVGIIGVAAWLKFVTLKKDKNIQIDFLFWVIFYFLGGLPMGMFERSIESFYFIFILLCTSLYCARKM